MREQLPMLAARDWIAGAILWCYQDYKSPRNLWPGETEGYVEHGVVDEARQRKPSYGVWRHLTRPAAISARWVGVDTRSPSGFEILATPNSAADLPYMPLHDYRLTWNLRDGDGTGIGGGEQRLGEWTGAQSIAHGLPPDAAGHAATLNVSLFNPAGAVVAEERLAWPH